MLQIPLYIMDSVNYNGYLLISLVYAKRIIPLLKWANQYTDYATLSKFNKKIIVI